MTEPSENSALKLTSEEVALVQQHRMKRRRQLTLIAIQFEILNLAAAYGEWLKDNQAESTFDNFKLCGVEETLLQNLGGDLQDVYELIGNLLNRVRPSAAMAVDRMEAGTYENAIADAPFRPLDLEGFGQDLS